jgi:hypothetical protein
MQIPELECILKYKVNTRSKLYQILCIFNRRNYLGENTSRICANKNLC